MTVIELAKIAHEANRAYCAFIGQEVRKSWEEATGDERNSSVSGVETALDDPTITPEDMHSAWSQRKLEDGWEYGEVIDRENKKHPCLVPYEEVKLEDKMKDFLFLTVVNLHRNQITVR